MAHGLLLILQNIKRFIVCAQVKELHLWYNKPPKLSKNIYMEKGS